MEWVGLSAQNRYIHDSILFELKLKRPTFYLRYCYYCTENGDFISLFFTDYINHLSYVEVFKPTMKSKNFANIRKGWWSQNSHSENFQLAHFTPVRCIFICSNLLVWVRILLKFNFQFPWNNMIRASDLISKCLRIWREI